MLSPYHNSIMGSGWPAFKLYVFLLAVSLPVEMPGFLCLKVTVAYTGRHVYVCFTLSPVF